MEPTTYEFNFVIGAFFQMATSDARRILPPHLQPLEVQHTRSILALTAFQFSDSMVGPYDEIVLAIVVPPMVQPGQPLPQAGFYPFVVGTSTEASRVHAVDRWHLPHYMKNVDIRFVESDGRMDAQVLDDGAPVLDLSVTDYSYAPVRNLYNSFMVDGDARFKTNIYMNALHSEHEEERGELNLHAHPMTEALTVEDVDSLAFREEWYRAGVQTIEPLETL